MKPADAIDWIDELLERADNLPTLIEEAKR
jgi:hypothetical protein